MPCGADLGRADEDELLDARRDERRARRAVARHELHDEDEEIEPPTRNEDCAANAAAATRWAATKARRRRVVTTRDGGIARPANRERPSSSSPSKCPTPHIGDAQLNEVTDDRPPQTRATREAHGTTRRATTGARAGRRRGSRERARGGSDVRRSRRRYLSGRLRLPDASSGHTTPHRPTDRPSDRPAQAQDRRPRRRARRAARGRSSASTTTRTRSPGWRDGVPPTTRVVVPSSKRDETAARQR